MNKPTFNNRLSQFLQLPGWIAGISFGLGTLILLFHLTIDRDVSYVIGLLYIMFAVFMNASVFGALLICSFLFKEYQKPILLQAAILLINIPVAVLYLFIFFNNPFLETNRYQVLKQSNQTQSWKLTKIS